MTTEAIEFIYGAFRGYSVRVNAYEEFREHLKNAEVDASYVRNVLEAEKESLEKDIRENHPPGPIEFTRNHDNLYEISDISML